MGSNGMIGCCLGCGRDTSGQSGYCIDCCLGRYRGTRDRGRKCRDPMVVAEHDNEADTDVPRSELRYHGER